MFLPRETKNVPFDRYKENPFRRDPDRAWPNFSADQLWWHGQLRHRWNNFPKAPWKRPAIVESFCCPQNKQNIWNEINLLNVSCCNWLFLQTTVWSEIKLLSFSVTFFFSVRFPASSSLTQVSQEIKCELSRSIGLQTCIPFSSSFYLSPCAISIISVFYRWLYYIDSAVPSSGPMSSASLSSIFLPLAVIGVLPCSCHR